MGPRWATYFEGHTILQRSKKVIERNFGLLQNVTQRGALDQSVSRDGDFDLFIWQLLLESDVATPVANHG